jgi:hypothetical protein
MERALLLPMNPIELAFIETTLKEAQVLVPGNYRDPSGPRLTDYIINASEKGIEFRAIFDRNLISPIVSLASGRPVPDEPEQERIARLSCAAFAFCIWADILIEPAMALYEYASATNNATAQDELRFFRIADNTNPRFFLDIALGNLNSLPPQHLAEISNDPRVQRTESREPNFSKRLTIWRRNYLFVLKAIDLSRTCENQKDAAEALSIWQARDSFFNAAAFRYCIAAMSHRPPKGKMLKGIQSQNVNTIRKGAFNATWDICLLQIFGNYVTTPGSPSWSLWSDDFALKSIARGLFCIGDESEEHRLRAFYSESWGKDGDLLSKQYLELVSKVQIDSPRRLEHIKLAFERMNDEINHLESKLNIKIHNSS